MWDRLDIAAKARKIRPSSPAKDHLALEQMRVKLLKDIEKFHKEASRFLPHAALPIALFLPPSAKSPGAGWDTLKVSENDAFTAATSSINSDVDSDGESDTDDPVASRQAPGPSASSTGLTASERITIALPSNMGAKLCVAHGLEDLMKMERRLRIGQMHDALHAVRVGVAYKSFLYRSSVRVATSYRGRLRSFDEVHHSNEETLAHARLYMCSRTSFMELFDITNPSDAASKVLMMKKYQDIQKPQLKANTALIEQKVRGVSQMHLPWFWSLDVNLETKGNTWLGESESTEIKVSNYSSADS